jgi:hypothetical protein
MSRSVDLFIDADIPIGELAAELGRLTDLTLDPRPDAPEWTLEEGEVRATLAEHPYVDDGDLLLAHYRYALSCQVTTGVRLQAAPETALLRLVAEALQHKSARPVLLVLDLQYRDPTASNAAAATPLDGPANHGAGTQGSGR